VSFSTNAWLSYGRSEVTGQQFVWNIRTQSLEPQKKAGAAGNDRIRFVIQPDKPPQVSTPEKEKEKEKKP